MWPYDDRFYEPAPDKPIPSALDEEVQDRIIDLHADRTLIVDGYSAQLDGSNLPAWVTATASPEFICRAAGYALCARCGFPHGVVIKEVKVKVYLYAASGLTLDLYADLTAMGGATTAPASVSLGDQLTPAPGGYPTWDVQEWSDGVNGFTETTLLPGSLIRVLIGDPDAQDCIGGVQIVYQPLTASS